MRASERESERQGERGRRGEGGCGRGWSAGSTKGRGDRSRSARRLRPQPHSGRRQPSPASLRCKCGPSALRFRRPFKERAPGSPPHPPTPTRTSTAGSLGFSESPATLHARPAVCSHSRRAPPAPSAGSPFSPFFPPCWCQLVHRPPGLFLTPKVKSQEHSLPAHTLKSTAKHNDGKGLRSSPLPCVSKTPSRRAASHTSAKNSGVCPHVACSFARPTPPGSSI